MASWYLGPLHSRREFERTIKLTSQKLEKLRVKLNIDALVFKGVSGMAIGFPLALQSKLTPVVVRKNLKESHASCLVEGPANIKGPRKYLIIDDTIASGETIQHILRSMSQKRKNYKCVGILLYDYACGITYIMYNKSRIPIFSVEKRIRFRTGITVEELKEKGFNPCTPCK